MGAHADIVPIRCRDLLESVSSGYEMLSACALGLWRAPHVVPSSLALVGVMERARRHRIHASSGSSRVFCDAGCIFGWFAPLCPHRRLPQHHHLRAAPLNPRCRLKRPHPHLPKSIPAHTLALRHRVRVRGCCTPLLPPRTCRLQGIHFAFCRVPSSFETPGRVRGWFRTAPPVSFLPQFFFFLFFGESVTLGRARGFSAHAPPAK